MALFCLGVLSAAPVEVTLFAPADDPALESAIRAQLVDLDIVLQAGHQTEPWADTVEAQLRQVRRLLLGTPARVAIWVERVPSRVHVTDLMTGEHVQREVVFDSAAQETAALMVRSAVESFVEQDVKPPGGDQGARFRVAALWHVTKWSTSLPWAQGPWSG